MKFQNPEKIYQAIFRQTPSITYLVNETNDLLVDASQRFFDQFMYPANDILTGKLHHSKLWTSNRQYTEFINQFIAQKPEHKVEADFTRSNGAIISCNVTGIRLKMEGENYLLVTLNETGNQKAIESKFLSEKQKAEESDRLKSAFLARMSHQIRTPLNSIMGFAELAKVEKLTEEEIYSYCTIISKNGIQLLKMVEDIIDFSRIEAGKVTLMNSETDINKLLNEVYNTWFDAARNKNLKLREVKLELNQFTIQTDPVRIKQILSLLLENAIKYTFSGSINFGYEIEGENIVFFVEDTGIGIDAKHHDEIFERFKKAEEERVSHYDGTGLGLFIVKGLVGLLGSRIELISEVGRGSKFYFSLPFRSNIEAVENDSFESIALHEKTLHKLSILIAEDTYDNYMFLKLLFNKYNIPVHHARNGKEAVEIFRKIPTIKLVLMDLNMPLMDGYEATRQIKKIRKRVKVLALTAYAYNNDMESAMNAGCDDYLSKPVSRNELIKKINELFS